MEQSEKKNSSTKASALSPSKPRMRSTSPRRFDTTHTERLYRASSVKLVECFFFLLLA